MVGKEVPIAQRPVRAAPSPEPKVRTTAPHSTTKMKNPRVTIAKRAAPLLDFVVAAKAVGMSPF